MDPIRSTEFREIPNKYQFIVDKTSVLKRNVLVEKTELDELSIHDDEYNYFYSFVEQDARMNRVNVSRINIREELEKTRVIIEKNIKLIQTKRDRKKYRKQFIENIGVNVKSSIDDITCDITSLENVDFNKPCTKEDKEELFKLLDHYVYRESIDEINCEIKQKDIDGVDIIRSNYANFNKDEISNSIKNFFTKNQTVRLPEDYMEQVNEKIENFFSRIIRRRVLIEKTGFETYQEFVKYDKLRLENKGKEGRYELLREFADREEYKQECEEIHGHIHRQVVSINE